IRLRVKKFLVFAFFIDAAHKIFPLPMRGCGISSSKKSEEGVWGLRAAAQEIWRRGWKLPLQPAAV
ncbi:MAG: hypothetical protein N3A66_09115, partial [Planctomycetota bacterium]|nr:hypothetical protein [Planctomycetota bacterium]